jgi:hypothetical protein
VKTSRSGDTMSGESKTVSNRGGSRPRAGRHPTTLRGLLRRLSPADAEKIPLEIWRLALQLLIDWAREELRREDEASGHARRQEAGRTSARRILKGLEPGITPEIRRMLEKKAKRSPK